MHASQRQMDHSLILEITQVLFFPGHIPLSALTVSAQLPKVFQRYVPFLTLKLHVASESFLAILHPNHAE